MQISAKRIAIAIAIIAIAMPSHAQGQLVPLDSLEASLKLASNLAWTAERKAYDYKVKGAWTKAIPHVGITLGLPNISWSPNQLFDIGNAKRQIRAKVESLDLEHTNCLNKNLANLRIDYQKILVQARQLEREQDLQQIRAQVFAIVEKQNNAHEILPADYLAKKLAFEESRANLERQKNELQIAVLELYKFASYGLPNVQIYYEAKDCILMTNDQAKK
jgi:hypothetical protein